MRQRKENEAWLEQAGILTQALPFMRRYSNKILVIKYGGHAMGDEALSDAFARDIVLLKQCGIHPVVVHGGGPQIGNMLSKLSIKSEFIDGLRVTDKATVEVVEMVLSGFINKSIVANIQKAGGYAVGLSGKDCQLITASPVQRKRRDPSSNIEKNIDLGFVGEPTHIDPHIIHCLCQSDIIPVIAPLGLGENGETYNINADTVAGALASSLKAARLLLLTDIEGVLDKSGNLITDLSVDESMDLLKDGSLSGGMIPKVETCIDAANNGVEATVILDGRKAHSILLEIFTDHGTGTLIRANGIKAQP